MRGKVVVGKHKGFCIRLEADFVHFWSLVNNSHGVGLGGILLALSGGLLDLGATLDEGISVLVSVELGDNDVGRVDSNLNSLSVGLLARDLLDVDDVLGARDEGDLSLLGVVLSDADEDLVVLADGHGTDTELGTQILREGRAHTDAALAGGSVEVSLALLSAGRRNTCTMQTNTNQNHITPLVRLHSFIREHSQPNDTSLTYYR